MLYLQRTIGNTAVGALLRSADGHHVHGDGCGHNDAGVQRVAVEDGLRSPGRPLDAATLADKEDKFQADLSRVRLHTGPVAASAAAAVEAHAFTVHEDIVLGERGDDPEVLDHELTHVVRNQQGAARGHDNGGGLSITHPLDDAEREAAANAARMRSGGRSQVVGAGPGATAAPASETAPVQRWYQGEAPPVLHVGPRPFTGRQRTPQLQARVDAFVNSLQRPAWYEDASGQVGTRQALLDRSPHHKVPDPFNPDGAPMQIWQCQSCKKGVSYAGVDLGHKVDWKQYLKQKGVLTQQEATAAYNDLNNLQIECSTCNRSHDWQRTVTGDWESGEDDSEGSLRDFIVADDQVSFESSEGSQRSRTRSPDADVEMQSQ